MKTLKTLQALSYSIIFLIGFLSCVALSYAIYGNLELPLGDSNISSNAPGDWIAEKDIHVYDNAIVIDVENADISRYAPTGSMLPTLNEDSNGIRIIPENADEIQIGDIITFQRDSDLIIHRVIEKGADEQGAWFITQGDNNSADDGKVYFKDVRYVTIGVLY